MPKEELKITTLDEVKTVLERLLSLMETEEPKTDEEEMPEEEASEDESEEEETEKATFTDAAWNTPESNLDVGKFCSVCLIDENPAGQEKVKGKCHLPIRSRPGAPINKAALRNAAARLNQTNASSESKAKAKRRLISLMNQAGIETSLSKEDEEVEFVAKAEILSKSSDEERIAYSIAYPAMPKGWKDSQGDRIEIKELEKAAHNWMINSTRYDLHHKELNVSKDDAVVVESFIAPVDIDWPVGNNIFKRVNKGSWIVATKFSDQLWTRVKKGEFAAYSIRGKAKRIQVNPAKS
jgi:hypothetical protein